MGDGTYQHPVALHWDQGPEKLKPLKNKLQLYFGSKSKSDGGDCEIRDTDCTRGYVLIHFKEETARDRVLQRKTHHLKLPDGTTLQLIVRLPEDGQSTQSSAPSGDAKTPPSTQEDPADHKVHQSPGEEEKSSREDNEVTLDPPSSQVLIENIQDSCSPEMLNLLVENISEKNEETDFHVEMIPEIRSAVVTFTSENDIPDFTGRFSGSPKVKQQKLRAKCLENTRSVRVEGLPANISVDFLDLYLESAKHGGGPLENKEMLPEEGAAIITFSSAEVVKTFLTKQHKFHNSVLSVYPYYPSIGQWLYGKKNNDIMTPGPVECPICAQILEFIFNNEEIKQSIEKQMTDHYCDVKWPKPGDPKPLITLSFPSNLSSHLRTLSKIAPTWSNKVQAEFSLLLSKYKVIECDLKPPVWEAIRTKVSSSSYDGVLIKPDIAAEKAFIVGISDDVKRIEPIFKKLVEETTRQLSRVEDEVPLEAAAYKLLLAHGLEKSIKEDSPHVNISYDGATKSIKLYGPKYEVLTAKCEILKTKQDLKSKSIQRDPSIIQFLMVADNEEMSYNLLMNNNIKAMFQVEDNAVMVFGYSDKDLKNAEETLKKDLVCKRVSVKDKSVTQSPEWGRLKSFINKKCNAVGIKVSIEELPGKEGNEVVITGLSSSVEEAYQQIQDFVGKNTLVQKDMKLKSVAALHFIEGEREKEWNGILKNVKVVKKQNFMSLSGPKIYVEEAETFVARMDSTLHSDTLYIDKPGAKKFCIDNEDMYISAAKKNNGCVIYFQKDGDTNISGHQPAEPLCQVNLQNEVTTALYKGDLCQHSADAIIIASNKDLKPSGGPALALLKAAGPKLQKECERIVQKEGELEPGENEITDVENLPCKKVIHAVGPKYSEKDKSKSERLLRKAITRSLEAAAENVLNSAAISLASFKASGIPEDICVENILKSIQQYAENEEGVKSLKNIHLVDNDDQALKTLTKFLKEEFGEENVQDTPKKSKKKHQWKKTSKKGEAMRKSDLSMVVTKEGVHVNLKHGNIENATTNVVVNSVGKELDLSSGAVSKALFGKAGNNLQNLLNNQKKGKEVKEGSVFVTDGCNLACDTVIHVVVPQWDGANGSAEKTLRDIIKKCLSETEERKKVSITFPAIGTGALAFPGSTVAALKFEEILNFSSKNNPVHLKEVNIMLHPKDSETIKAFSTELDKKTGSHKEVEKTSVRSLAQGTHEMKIGALTFQVKKGDVTMETADVIVSLSTSETNKLPDIGGTPVKKILISDTSKPDELKQSVRNILQDCETKKNTSIVFSAMESGLGMVSSDVVAEPVLDAVTEFVSHNSPKSVLMVKLITPLQQIVDDFLNAMKVKAGSAAAKQSSWLSGFAKYLVSYVTGSNKEDEEEDSNVFEFRENIEPAIIQLCAESQDAVDKTKVWLRDRIMKEQYENIITDDCIQDFDDKNHEALRQLQKTYQVTVIFESPGSTVKVLGLSKDVLEISKKIQDMIKNVRDKKMREREAELYSNLVEWGYLSGGKFVPFDKMTNADLEKAMNEKRQSIHISINGAKYTVIVELKTAKDPKGNSVELQRNDKHEQKSLPSHWMEMKNSSMEVVQLVPKSEEYIKVQTEFEKSCLMKIIKIERIQNKPLWLNYEIKKSSIEDKNKMESERLLFHGTDAKAIDNVNKNGFNRSYAGKNDAKIGRGTYFAVEAIYSSDDQYSIPDQSSGHKHMYLARVLTGIFCMGNDKLIVPPPKDNANPTDLYDSVADDTTNPTVFAIFSDIQAYPEYLITFTK
ncbi:protein mono-ADP-ribosyltransferase PARP14-like isoform X2 [Aquarana catesbeiana]|uniref:protein mono-ADP-ribosyltransferase PARP14-like isoform X2 n=1 Tax=Aquarana catesbeiana TaxID=8400 RepID=UPI003CC9B5D3